MAHSKWVIHYPDVPHIWPVKVGTSLTQAEVEDLEAASFQIDDGKEVLPMACWHPKPGLLHSLALPRGQVTIVQQCGRIRHSGLLRIHP
jgi:hypothetical protein